MKNLTIILLILFVSAHTYTQQIYTGIPKSGGNETVQYFYSNSSNGNTANPMLTTVKPETKKQGSKEQGILNDLIAARKRGDRQATLHLQDQLDNFYGNTVKSPGTGSNLLFNDAVNINTFSYNNAEISSGIETDYQVTSFGGLNCRSISIASAKNSRAIFAAVTEYLLDTNDRIKIFVSYNGGLSWVLKFSLGGTSLSPDDFRQGELDIMPVIYGNDTVLFCAAGVDYNNQSHVWYYRFNIRDSTFSNPGVFRTYFNDNGVNYYNPKLTTDQVLFSELPYVYLMAAFDSTNAKIGTRLGIFTAPFQSNGISFKSPNRDGSFWWNSNGHPVQYVHHDVCYLKDQSSTGFLYTVYSHKNPATQQNIYAAWSPNFNGVVDSTKTIVIIESSEISNVICKGNNFANNKLAIGYRKMGDGNWDYRVQYSINYGITFGSFTPYYIENTSEDCMSISMEGIDSGDGRFVHAYTTANKQHWYRKFNQGTLSTPMLTNTVLGSTNFGGVQAGYWNSPNADSCVVGWLSYDSSRANFTSLVCSSPVGIDPVNPVPKLFSLAQNYPNPFNPVTSIRFSIPKTGFVKLTIYDLTGRVTASIVNGELSAGIYNFDIDASNFASGIYFYRLESHEFSQTKKMVLVK